VVILYFPHCCPFQPFSVGAVFFSGILCSRTKGFPRNSSPPHGRLGSPWPSAFPMFFFYGVACARDPFCRSSSFVDLGTTMLRLCFHGFVPFRSKFYSLSGPWRSLKNLLFHCRTFFFKIQSLPFDPPIETACPGDFFWVPQVSTPHSFIEVYPFGRNCLTPPPPLT